MAYTMASTTALTTLQTVFTAILQWGKDFLAFVSEEPLLLIGVAIFCVGATIGIVRRMIG